MAKSSPITIYGAVEGDVDEIVLRRLLDRKNFFIAGIYGRQGKDYLKHKISNYNNAAKYNYWIVLVDLNSSANCAPSLISNWLPKPSPFMSLRVVVHAIESWLLSDKERIAHFLSITKRLIPSHP